MHTSHLSPSELTPTQRRSEVAAILAQGLLRYLRMKRSTPCGPTENPSNSSETGLDLSADTRPCVSDRPAG